MQTCPCADATSHVDYGLEKVLSHLVQPPHKVFMSRTQTQTRRPQAAPLSPTARQHAAGSMSCFCKTLPAADTHARLHIRTLRRCGMLNNPSGMYLTASFHPPQRHPTSLPCTAQTAGGRGWRRRSGGALKPRWRAAGHGKRRRTHVNALGRPA